MILEISAEWLGLRGSTSTSTVDEMVKALKQEQAKDEQQQQTTHTPISTYSNDSIDSVAEVSS
jgi:hypothetical protein